MTPAIFRRVFIGIRQRSTLPGRLQPSTIDAEGLNFCVRDGNRWNPFAIVTGNRIFFRYPFAFLILPVSPPDTSASGYLSSSGRLQISLQTSFSFLSEP